MSCRRSYLVAFATSMLVLVQFIDANAPISCLDNCIDSSDQSVALTIVLLACVPA